MKREYFDGKTRSRLKLPTIVVNKHHTNRPGTVVMRGTPWGNPFVLGRDGDRREVLRKFCLKLREDDCLVKRAREELAHQVLICCCKPLPCHGDIWVRVVNGESISSIWEDFKNSPYPL